MTTQTILAMVRTLSDSQVPMVLQELFDDVYSTVPYADVKANTSGVTEIQGLLQLDDQSLDKKLSAEDSVRIGRVLLEQYAQDPSLAGFVEAACSRVKQSDSMFIEMALPLVVLVNLTYLVMTTEVTVRKDPNGNVIWGITKKASPPKLVSQVVTMLLRAVGGGG